MVDVDDGDSCDADGGGEGQRREASRLQRLLGDQVELVCLVCKHKYNKCILIFDYFTYFNKNIELNLPKRKKIQKDTINSLSNFIYSTLKRKI